MNDAMMMMIMASLAHEQSIKREMERKKKEEELKAQVFVAIILLALVAVSFLPLIALIYGKDAVMLALAVIIPSTVSLIAIAYFLLISFHHDY